MIEKIVGLIFAIAGICAGLLLIGIGVYLIMDNSNIFTWLACIAIFCLSTLLMFISLCPLIGCFVEKPTALKKETPVEPEKEKVKLGFFAPIELV